MIDTLATTNDLLNAGIERPQAEAIARNISNVAKEAENAAKAVIKNQELATRGDLRGGIQTLEGKIDALRAAMYRALLMLGVALVGAQIAIVTVAVQVITG